MKLLKLHAVLADNTALNRVTVNGVDGVLPTISVEVRQSARERYVSVLMLEIPLQFVELEQLSTMPVPKE